MKVHNLLVTGSLTSGGENITAISSSVSSTVTSLSSSVSTSIGSLSSSMVSSMTSLSSSLTSSMGSLSSSMASSMTSLSSSLTGSMGSLSSSMVTSMNNLSSSMGSIMATTGSNLFKGDQTISGSIIPAVNGLYDLGSITNEFRDLYLSSASLYIDGTKVLGSTTQELTITTDTGQSFKILEAGSDTITLQAADGNITFATSGGGDVILDPTSGVIALKGTTTLYAGNKILSSDGNAIQIGNSVTMTGSLVVTGFIETQELRTTYISSSILYRSGSTKFGDELTDTHAFSGSVSISGSLSVPESNLVSGSSQITYSGLSSIPSGIISGSSQLPSGLVSGSSQITYGSITSIPSGIVSGSAQVISLLPGGTVSGSVQVDVMSTTNIARLATTGSNTFSGNIDITVANTPQILLTHSNTSKTFLMAVDGGNAFFRANSTNNILFQVAGGTTALTLSSTSAATFSSSVQAASLSMNTGPSADRVLYISANLPTIGAAQFQSVMNGTFINAATDVYGMYVQNNSNVNLTNSYAIFLPSTGGSGTITNKYGVYQSGGSDKNYFAGNVGINTTSFGYVNTKLQVNGTSTTDENAGTVFIQHSFSGTNGFGLAISRNATSAAALSLGADSSNNAIISANNTNLRLGKNTSGTFYEYLNINTSGTLTTSNVGIANQNTYLGSGQLRVGGGLDHGSNVVLSIAPGVVKVDAPGVAGGRLNLDNSGNLTIGNNITAQGSLQVNTNGFSLKGWRQYAVQISAGGSTNTGAIILRQFQDSVNWNTGGVVVEIINYSYAHNEYDTRKDFARYGYSGNAATVNQINGNITGKIPQPYWGSAIQGSGNLYYRDLMIDISPYHAYVINITTPMSLNGNTTVGNGTIYLFS